MVAQPITRKGKMRVKRLNRTLCSFFFIAFYFKGLFDDGKDSLAILFVKGWPHFNALLKILAIMMVMKFLKDSSGASFIQVLLASTAIASLALIGLKMADDQREVVKRTYQNYLVEYLSQEIGSLLKKSSICSESFRGLDPREGESISLKENLNKLNNEEIFQHFPTIELGENYGKYFDNQISLVRYRLSLQPKGANLEKGVTGLIVTFQLLPTGRKIDREFLLNFEAEKSGLIKSCRIVSLEKTKKVKGYWYLSEDVLRLENAVATISNPIFKNAGLNVGGALYLEKDGKELPCTWDIEGVLRRNKKGLPVFCSGKKWIPLGEHKIEWNFAKLYNIGRNELGSQSLFTEEHRFCYLSHIKKNSTSDGCKLRRMEKTDYFSVYEVSAFTSNSATNMNCEVRCVD